MRRGQHQWLDQRIELGRRIKSVQETRSGLEELACGKSVMVLEAWQSQR